MKTLITLSSILAAGTLAVNAATTFDIGGKSYGIVESTLFPSTEKVTTSATLQTTLFNANSNWDDSTDTGLFSDNPLNLNPTRNYLQNISGTSAGTWYYDNDSGAAPSSGNEPIYSVSENGLTSIQRVTTTGKGQTVVAAFGVISRDDFGEISDLYLHYNVTVAAGYPVNLAVFSYQGSGTITRLANVEISETKNDVLLSLAPTGLGTSSVDTTFVVALRSNSTAWQGASFSSMAFVTTIPEPSAFGLLAGLGALALAGTRRRRR